MQQLSGNKESFQNIVNQAVAEIKPEPPRKMQEMGVVQEDKQYTPLFSKLRWFNHPGLTGLPVGKTVFISFWRGHNNILGETAPGRALDAVLKNTGS